MHEELRPDAALQTTAGLGTPRALVNYYFRRLRTATRILDLGCGRGDVGRYGPGAARIFGLDIDQKVLRVAGTYEVVAAWNGESGSLPLRDGSVDAVIAKDILEHVQRPGHLVAEMYRVLSGGGQAIVSVPMPKARVVWDDYTHVRGFTERAIRALVTSEGFTVVDLWRMGPVPGSARFDLMNLVPWVLAIQPVDWVWGSSWELLLRKPE